MHEPSDAQLLRDYVRLNREAAFSELVKRHANLVYSAALRQVESADIAGEVAQSVFIALARGAEPLLPRLAEEASLAGWLCRTARNLSLNLRRDEFRRHSRETQAMQQLEPNPGASPDWERLRPVLDDAMSELAESDYDALVMRFFENQDLRSVGLALGVTDDTAQKRVARALEKLREHLSRRGITTTAAALPLVLAGNAVQSAPAGLTAAISSAVAISQTTLVATAATALKPIAMTTLQKTLVTCAIAAAIGSAVYESHEAAKSRNELQMLREQKAREALRSPAGRANAALVTAASPRDAQDKTNSTELLKLRAEVTRLRREAEAAAIEAKHAEEFEAQVQQVESNTPPIRTFVSTTLSTINWDQGILAGGWKTPSGKRAMVLVTVQPGNDPKQLTINSKVLEYSDDSAEKLGLSQYNVDTASTSMAHTLNSDQSQALMQAAQNSEGVQILAAPSVSMESGRQSEIQIGDELQTPSGEKYSTGPKINFFPRISADGQTVQMMVAAQLNYMMQGVPEMP